jgi:serine/threonine-protein kinase
MLFTADEVAAGHIDHAIRFILPNDRIKPGYVRPATHSTSTTGGSTAPAYGVHLRLRADFPISTLSPGAQVVARALQTYGMYQADGGNIALTAQSDKHTTHKWSGLLGSHDLEALKVSDFQVISHGSVIDGDDCTREP